MTIQKLLKLAALVFFIAAGIGFSTVSFGTVTLNLIGFGLACWVGSEL